MIAVPLLPLHQRTYIHPRAHPEVLSLVKKTFGLPLHQSLDTHFSTRTVLWYIRLFTNAWGAETRAISVTTLQKDVDLVGVFLASLMKDQFPTPLGILRGFLKIVDVALWEAIHFKDPYRKTNRDGG
jgi:hypothetical protein